MGTGIEGYYGLGQQAPDYSSYTEGYRRPRNGSSLDALLTRQRARLGAPVAKTSYGPDRREIAGPPDVYRPVAPAWTPRYQPPPITLTTPGVGISARGTPGQAPDAPYQRPGFPERLDLPIPWSQTFDALGTATTGVLSGDTGALIGVLQLGQARRERLDTRPEMLDRRLERIG